MTPSNRAQRIQRILSRLLLVTVSTVVVLFLADRGVRFFNLFGAEYEAENMRYRTELCDLRMFKPDGTPDLDGVLLAHKPGAFAAFHDFEVRINRLGFRGPEIADKKPEGVTRILALGDSVTFGWGVNDTDTYVRRLEGALNRREDARRYEVINAGHLMFDTTQELALLRERGLPLDPDIVLLTFVVNDLEPSRKLAEALIDLHTNPPPPPPAGQRILGKLADWWPGLYAIGKHFGSAPPAAYRSPEAARAFVPEEHGNGPEGWERSKTALLAIRDACRQKGARLLLLDHSYPPVQALPGFCREHDIPYRELRFSPDELAQPIYNSAIDPHANRLGNELLLDKLIEALAAEKLP